MQTYEEKQTTFWNLKSAKWDENPHLEVISQTPNYSNSGFLTKTQSSTITQLNIKLIIT
jgi:hypothetical protein